jgi:hypothetical protein
MTNRTDFTEDEWELLREAPASAGLAVSTAQRGGTFREAISMGKAYSEAREQHGSSELLDEIVSAKPEVDREDARTPEELKQVALQKLRDAVALLEQKATPEEVEGYKGFVLSLAERVAAAKDEGESSPESGAERAVIEEIRQTLGASA